MRRSVKSGDFIRSPDHGFGRLLSISGGTARVRYFTGPSGSPYLDRDLDSQIIEPAVLRRNTRVYVHSGQGWEIGRIDGLPDVHNVYAIAFPNRRGAQLEHDAFEVRWSEPIHDPFVLLEALGGESPIVAESRLGFLRKWTRQRAAGVGVDGLLQASVELHRHQLAVVRRVSSDPIKRYLLADEVGLGKTIEAAALIWQFLDRNENGRVLVLVPQHLRHQWATELADRFRPGVSLDGWIRIRPIEDNSKWPDEPPQLVVIDEAHRVTRNGSLEKNLRDQIVGLAHDASELLLLSATPVRSNEAGFLDLLHLLDPDHYQPDQVEAFTRRVHDRDSLALICQGLVSDIDEFDLTLYAEQLEAEYPEDLLLVQLLAVAISADSALRPGAVARVRQHISEAYRLHRRVLRTRRTPAVVESFGVRGRRRSRPFMVPVACSNQPERTQLLDDLRVNLLVANEVGDLEMDECVDVFREVAQRCASLPDALLPLLSFIIEDAPTLVLRFRALVLGGVLPNMDRLLTSIGTDRTDLKLAVVDALAPFTGNRTHSRVVVASAFSETAAAVSDEMRRRWGSGRVVTHLLTNSESDNRAAIEHWMKGGASSVLVVDSSAEEGVNLQIADLLVHLDLPWETFRIEQRIGRCDRHSTVSLGPIESKVVAWGDEPYAMGWLEFVSDGCDAFARSLSALQYVLSDTERETQESVLREGPEALSNSAIDQVERLAAEHIRIVAHDALDQIEEDASEIESESLDERLLRSDENPSLTKNLMTWLEGVGTRISWQDNHAVYIRSDPRPQVPIELEAKIVPYFNSILAVERAASVARRLPILRTGHPMLEAVAQHLLQDDRGVAFAILRPFSGMVTPEVGFRSDYLIAPSLDGEFLNLATELGLRTWVDQVLRDLCSPVVERVVIDPENSEVTEGHFLRPYDARRGDVNLMSRPELFDEVIRNSDWSFLCRQASRRNREILDARIEREWGARTIASRLKDVVERQVDRNKARKIAGLAGSGLEDAVERLELVMPEHVNFSVTPLGCGAVIVADRAVLAEQ